MMEFLIISYVINTILNYLLLRHQHINGGIKLKYALVLSVIPITNFLILTAILIIYIEEKLSYDKFLDYLFFTKKNDKN